MRAGMPDDIELGRDQYRVISPVKIGLFPKVLAWLIGLGGYALLASFLVFDGQHFLGLIGTRQFWFTIGLGLVLTFIGTRRRRH